MLPVETWLALLRQWNERIDLTAARSEDELHDLMLADATELAAWIPRGVSVVDVGTGAGAPGLALALLRPDLKVTLAEPLTKRASFLRTVIGTLGRTDITLLPSRGETLAEVRTTSEGAAEDAWEVAISRATLPPPEWLALGLRLAPSAWVLLAKEDAPPGRIAEEHTYTWPKTGVSRRAVRYERP